MRRSWPTGGLLRQIRKSSNNEHVVLIMAKCTVYIQSSSREMWTKKKVAEIKLKFLHGVFLQC